MEFYQSIAEYYHYIFPFNKTQVDFVKSSGANNQNLSLLDVGCGIGDLSLGLAEVFANVVGIDLDEEMIRRTGEKSKRNLSFLKLNMLDIEKQFGSNAFDRIISFGNTLVHLNSEESILNFFKQAKHILKPEGKLLFQIINYDRIIDQNIDSLPTLENDQIRFERNYRYHPNTYSLDFNTVLMVKEKGVELENTVQLLPIRKSKLKQFLIEAGFSNLSYYADFKKNPWKIESIPLIIEAEN